MKKLDLFTDMEFRDSLRKSSTIKLIKCLNFIIKELEGRN